MRERNEPREKEAPGTWWVVLETTLLAAGAVGLGLLIQPEDPFFTRNTFAWLALGPLLAGLRYGFASGLGCALLLVALLFGHHHMGWAPELQFPAELAFGLVVVGAVSGEFRDKWERKLVRGAIEGAWHRQRLEAFSRSYHLLRVSHEHLEQRLARGGGSLRHALTQLKEKAVHPEAGGSRLEQLGDTFLQICATYCGVQAAALYGVNGLGMVDERPAARLGDVRPLRPEEPLLQQALSSGEVVTLKEQPGTGGPVAAVPLTNIRGQVHGVITVDQMHFPAIQADTFRTLAVLGAYVGELLARAPGPGTSPDSEFLHALQQSLHGLKRHGLPTSLVAITCHGNRGIPGLEKLALQKRGLDEQWLAWNGHKEQVLLLLLPLTDEAAANGCRSRLEKLLGAFHEGEAPPPYTFQVETLGVSDRAEEVMGRVLGRIHVETNQAPGAGVPAHRSDELGITPRV